MPPSDPSRLAVPVEYYRLDNGLRVVLSPDTSAPTVVAAVYYDVGFRSEPQGRSGFAHLFEHLMFQGSANLGKMEFIRLIQENGGVLNGSTRFDFTNYFAVVPAHKLETVLWAEADRMRSLDISEANLVNQRDVVKNEVIANVLNQPYGGLGWLDLPQAAFEKWANAHNYYGDFTDLDAATLEEARAFFRAWYAPGNAVVVVTGDFDPPDARRWVAQYFEGIPAGPPPPQPDAEEPPPSVERRRTRVDPLANRPALSVGWQVPPRGSQAYWAMGLLDQLLLQGEDSRLEQLLVRRHGFTGSVDGGINLLGNMYNYRGPMLWAFSLIHDEATTADTILGVVDDELERLAAGPVGSDEIERVRVKARSDLYDIVGGSWGVGRADLLASFALFDDDPARINAIEGALAAVTPEAMQAVARDFLRPHQRTVVIVEAGAGDAEVAA